MAQRLATPGVYIEEKNAFPNSVAGIPTAIPAFVGYTEKVVRNGESLLNRPVRLRSMAEFEAYFGGRYKGKYVFNEVKEKQSGFDFNLGEKAYKVDYANPSRFIFYDMMRMFFANGGGDCFVVSVGTYETTVTATGKGDKEGKKQQLVNEISKKSLQDGIASLVTTEEPTLLVVPEAVMLSNADCYAVQAGMLSHCGDKMQNIFSILDVKGGEQPRSYDAKDVITNFRNGVPKNYLAYGASYYPYLNATIVGNEEVDFTNVQDANQFIEVISAEASSSFSKEKAEEIIKEAKKMVDGKENVVMLHQTLMAVSGVYKKAMQAIRKKENILPPSASIAGCYTATDNNKGVWKSPANLGLAEVVGPAVHITKEDQEDLNVTISGKSVNAIRSFVNEGTLVWGARTMDGNSQDWRYINVRRTMIFLEQSIKYAAKAYVYEANNAATWTLVKSMISSFLNNVWKQGGLAGAAASDAYEVEVGLGSTMTPNDILDGVMKIQVKVAVTRPAEFIVITFQQKMQES